MFIRLLVFLYIVVYTNLVVAGCGESEKHCFYYREGKLISQSLCTIAECANMYGGLQNWLWKNGNKVNITVENELTLVNGKPGSFVEKHGMNCYSTGVNELLCNHD